jgi:4-deoxy-L-threo-5-hexosulose-uronate ketol-isomerase
MTHTDTTSRFAIDPRAAAAMASSELRRHFHIADLFKPARISLTYTHYDRMIVGGAMPSAGSLELTAIKRTGTKNFLDRRELIAVNIGGAGSVRRRQGLRTCRARRLFMGMGTEAMRFSSKDAASTPAKFYLLSAPAHQAHPTKHIAISDAKRIDLGSQKTSNERSIFQFIHADGVKTCQLVVGMTQLAEGSVWNTMPCHVHDRRMEVYFYFDLPDTARVFILGEPQNAPSSPERRGRTLAAPVDTPVLELPT